MIKRIKVRKFPWLRLNSGKDELELAQMEKITTKNFRDCFYFTLKTKKQSRA